MTLDQAIQHCYEQAERISCRSCAEEHLQLAKWLEELRERRVRDEVQDDMPLIRRWAGFMDGLGC